MRSVRIVLQRRCRPATFSRCRATLPPSAPPPPPPPPPRLVRAHTHDTACEICPHCTTVAGLRAASHSAPPSKLSGQKHSTYNRARSAAVRGVVLSLTAALQAAQARSEALIKVLSDVRGTQQYSVVLRKRRGTKCSTAAAKCAGQAFVPLFFCLFACRRAHVRRCLVLWFC